MSAVVIAFPAKHVPSRAVIEAIVECLIDLLDAEDLSTAECEPDVAEASDEGEIENWQEWHTRSSVRRIWRSR